MSGLFRKKPLSQLQQEHIGTGSGVGLRKELGVRDLTFMGIAAVIGAGIFSTIGQAAYQGGPGISLLFVVFGTFKDIIEYVGISLTIFSMLVVFGVFIIRARKLHDSNTIRSFAYPFAPILFLASGLWMIYFFVAMDPQKLLWSVSTLVPGVLLYYASKIKRANVHR